MSDYILVTPAKNEGANLPFVIKSVLEQSIKPKVWLIVDDGSTDDTDQIIEMAKRKYDWIKSVRLTEHPRDITFHYSFVCKTGFDEIISYCKGNNIHYHYIGLLDADTEICQNFIESLINHMKADSKLGIVSGGIYHNINGTLEWNQSNENLPAGTGRLWRKECFFQTDGYLVEPSPDSISNAKALLRGWKIKKYKDIIAIERRITSSAEGLWKGYSIRGKCSYYLNKNPLLIFFNSFFLLIQKPYYIGIAFGYGYIRAVIHHGKKIEDPEIREYNWNKRLYEYLLVKNK
jgi:glycosyltransferase involved in cell wall biosynthesis